MILTPERCELLLNGAEPMICIEGVLDVCEDGRMSMMEIQVVVMTIGPTSSSRGCVTNELFEKFRLSLKVLLDPQKKFRHRWWWGWVRSP